MITEALETRNLALVLSFIVQSLIMIWVASLFLWLFYWQQMLRQQEHYADYFVQQHTSDPNLLGRAIGRYLTTPVLKADTTHWYSSILQTKDTLTNYWHRLMFPFWDWLSHHADQAWYRSLHALRTKIIRLRNYNPTLAEREAFLENPQEFHSNWLTVALRSVFFVLSLELFLATPLAGYHLGNNIIQFPTIVIFLILSSWVQAQIAFSAPIKRPIIKIILLIYATRLAWITLNFLLVLTMSIFAPNQATALLNLIDLAGNRSATLPTPLSVTDSLAIILEILPSYYGLQLLSILTLLLMIWLYYLLQAKHPAKLTRHWQLVLYLSIFATTIVLTPISNLLQGSSLSPSLSLAFYSLGFFSLVSLGYLYWQKS